METFSTEESRRNQNAFEQQLANLEPQAEQKNPYAEAQLENPASESSELIVEVPINSIDQQLQYQIGTQTSSHQESQASLDDSPGLLFSAAEHNPTEDNLERLAVSSHA